MKQPLGAPLAVALWAASVVRACGLRWPASSAEGSPALEAAAADSGLATVVANLVPPSGGSGPPAKVNASADDAHGEASAQQRVNLAASKAGTWQGQLFVFGYGSLLKEMSRIKTTCNLTSVSESTLETLERFAWVQPSVSECIQSVRNRKMILVKAVGVRRGWYDPGRLQGEMENIVPSQWDFQALDLSPAFLGAVADPDAECYGVLYPVNAEELELTDQREMAYGTVAPMWLGAEKIEVLTEGYSLPPGAQVRWYQLSKDQVARPNHQHPICQSYVDVFIGGALELAKAHHREDYAKNVVMTTYDWSTNWVNDRIVPYRPYVHESKAHLIVRTLIQAAKLPNSTIKLEHLAGVRFPLAHQEGGPSADAAMSGALLPLRASLAPRSGSSHPRAGVTALPALLLAMLVLLHAA